MPTIPGNELYYAIHLILVFGLSIWIAKKHDTRHKLLLFVYAFYLLGGSIAEVLTFKVPGISFFEFQPDRIVLIFNLGYLTMLFLYRHNREVLRKKWYSPMHEWIYFSYIIFIFIALIVHFNTLEFKEVAVLLAKYTTFGTLYIVLKVTMEEQLFKGIAKIFIIAGVITSIYSILQFVYDPLFMRFGEMRAAYGSVVRANGMFNTEYVNSYTIMAALAWSLVLIKSVKIKVVLTGLFVLAILLTFHRMSWLIITVFLAVYLVWFQRARLSVLGTLGIGGAAVLLIVGILFSQEILNSQIVQERVNEGIDSRFGYYDMVLDNIGEKPFFGYANKKNDVYYHAMLQITKSLARATGEEGSIHNGYLSNLFYYGVPALVLFTLMIFSSLRFFLKLARIQPLYTIAVLFIIVYAIANLTNSFLPSKHVAMVFGIHVGIFGGVLQNRIFPLSKTSSLTEA